MAAGLQTKGHTDFMYKMFIFILYSEGEIDYIRRQDFRFYVNLLPLRNRFNKTSTQVWTAFKSLENVGLIYNLTREYAAAKFHLRPPCYLKLSSLAEDTEKKVAGKGFYGE